MANSDLTIGDLVEYGGIICQVGAISGNKKTAVIKNGKNLYKVKISILNKVT